MYCNILFIYCIFVLCCVFKVVPQLLKSFLSTQIFLFTWDIFWGCTQAKFILVWMYIFLCFMLPFLILRFMKEHNLYVSLFVQYYATLKLWPHHNHKYLHSLQHSHTFSTLTPTHPHIQHLRKQCTQLFSMVHYWRSKQRN